MLAMKNSYEFPNTKFMSEALFKGMTSQSHLECLEKLDQLSRLEK